MNRTEFLEHLSDVCEVKPETIENFKDSPDTLFNMACEWEGFIGFGQLAVYSLMNFGKLFL